MNTSDPGWMSATEMAAQVASKSLSPNEIAEEMIRRVDEINPAVNAIVHFDADQVRRDAAELTRAQASGEQLGPLHGVPFTIKDLTDVRGLPTTFGLKPMRDNIAERDAVIVTRLRQAGGLYLGKTNTPESGYYGGTDNHLFGPTHNPWKPGHTAGGSSGGAAAAVAAGLGPLAEGSDGAGSVRIPSALCGVVGLKPTTGVIPQTILPGRYNNWAYHGPITRTVADNALMLDVLAGPIIRILSASSESRRRTSRRRAGESTACGSRGRRTSVSGTSTPTSRPCVPRRSRASRRWARRSSRRPPIGEIRRRRCGTASGCPASRASTTCSTGTRCTATSTRI